MSNLSVTGTSSERDRQLEPVKMSLSVLKRQREGELNIPLSKLKEQDLNSDFFSFTFSALRQWNRNAEH